MLGRGDWNGNGSGGSRGGIRLMLRGRRVRCAGKNGRAGRYDLALNCRGLRDWHRRRYGDAAEIRTSKVRSELSHECLPIRGKIAKVRYGSGCCCRLRCDWRRSGL